MQRITCTIQQPVFNRLLPLFKTIFNPLILLILAVSINAADIDLDKLLKSAKKQNKHIMFFHHIPECPYCETMIDENFKNSTILKEIDKNFIYVDIYTKNKDTIKFKDFKGSHKEFSKYLGAFVYPSTIFMNNNGDVIHKAIGYRNIDEFLAEITYVSSQSYKTMDLESYLLNLEFEKE